MMKATSATKCAATARHQSTTEKFWHEVVKRAEITITAIAKVGNDAPGDGVAEVVDERVRMKRKAHDEKHQEAGCDDGAGQLPEAMERQRVFHAPAEAGHAQREPRHRRGQPAEFEVKFAKHRGVPC